MNQELNIENLIFKRKFLNHSRFKEIILNDIMQMGIHSAQESKQCISNTDYFLPNFYERKYINHLLPEIQFFISEVNAFFYPLKSENIKLTNFWFQQYSLNDFHGFHVHGDSILSCVYYLELPNLSSRTTFNFLNNQFDYEVEEGDIICYPAFMQHASKPNQSTRKTIIAFNLSVNDQV